MFKIRIEDNEVRGLLQRLSRRMKNLRPVMRVISFIMLDSVEENFARQGRPKWQGLAPKTIKDRERKGYWPGKILQRTGQLAGSMTTKHTNSSAMVGTNKRQAPALQFGSKKRNIPARPYMILAGKDLEKIKQKLADYSVKGAV